MSDRCALVAVLGQDWYPCRDHPDENTHFFAAHWPACPAPWCKLPPGHRELHDVPAGTVTTLSAGYARALLLERLAAEMLASFTKGSDGYRARAGQVQIAKWQKRIEVLP